jgi:hypothetical protein
MLTPHMGVGNVALSHGIPSGQQYQVGMAQEEEHSKFMDCEAMLTAPQLKADWLMWQLQ